MAKKIGQCLYPKEIYLEPRSICFFVTATHPRRGRVSLRQRDYGLILGCGLCCGRSSNCGAELLTDDSVGDALVLCK